MDVVRDDLDCVPVECVCRLYTGFAIDLPKIIKPVKQLDVRRHGATNVIEVDSYGEDEGNPF